MENNELVEATKFVRQSQASATEQTYILFLFYKGLINFEQIKQIIQ